MGEDPPNRRKSYADSARQSRKEEEVIRFDPVQPKLTVSTSVKNFRQTDNKVSRDALIAILEEKDFGKDVSTIQLYNGRVEITFHNEDGKNRLLKTGIEYKKVPVAFSDDAKRYFNVTISGIHGEFDVK